MFDLKTILDHPNIPWKLIISGFSIAQFSFESYLTYRQYQKLSETKLPPVLEDEIDDETFHKSRNYSRAKAKFSIFGDVYNLAQKLVFIKYDLFPKIWHMAVSLSNAVLPVRFHMVSTVAQSLCFWVSYPVCLPWLICHSLTIAILSWKKNLVSIN